MRICFCLALILAATLSRLSPLDAADDIPKIARKLPPPGIEIPAADLARLREKTDALAKALKNYPYQPDFEQYPTLVCDAEIYLKAVQYALDNGEFFDVRDVKKAEQLLARGQERLSNLRKAPWHEQRGTLVRGLRSKIDDSVQPYGLVIPEKLDLSKPVPL